MKVDRSREGHLVFHHEHDVVTLLQLQYRPRELAIAQNRLASNARDLMVLPCQGDLKPHRVFRHGFRKGMTTRDPLDQAKDGQHNQTTSERPHAGFTVSQGLQEIRP